jgi:2,5-diketo-D-gluconate reductase A
MTTNVPTLVLNNGVAIPQVGFGVFQIPRPETVRAVLTAFEAGYRHIDTAQMYGNEAEVGEAVAASGLPRGEVFLTTKLHNERHGHDAALAALDESLERMRTAYVDLYLIHWPVPDEDRYVATWRACEALLADGKARAIGVSNLYADQLQRLAARATIVPAVNQVEVHPHVQRAGLRAYHRAHGIATEAWSPIARGRSLGDPTIATLARKHDKSAAQIILRWQVQAGNVLLTKSATPARMRENIALFDFALDDEDMRTIAALDGDPHGATDRTAEAAHRMPRWTP